MLLTPKSFEVKTALALFAGVYVFVSALLALIHDTVKVAEDRAKAEDDQKADFNRVALLWT